MFYIIGMPVLVNVSLFVTVKSIFLFCQFVGHVINNSKQCACYAHQQVNGNGLNLFSSYRSSLRLKEACMMHCVLSGILCEITVSCMVEVQLNLHAP